MISNFILKALKTPARLYVTKITAMTVSLAYLISA